MPFILSHWRRAAACQADFSCFFLLKLELASPGLLQQGNREAGLLILHLMASSSSYEKIKIIYI